ncbi:mRNA cap-binding protein [Forsythia ovata]|uniref:eIF-4F 25 kDa subunit n=1 Tax=Forsythia ovata TaxID=205694 RepID=A0ABD1S2B2_9LAMI
MASGKKYDVFHSVTSNDYYFIPNTCSGTVILCEACHKPYAWLGLACSVYYSVHLPSKLAVGANLHCFKNKIEPKWKDRVYAHGGEWTVTFSGHEMKYVGAIVNVRCRQEKIALSTKNATNEAAQVILFEKITESFPEKQSFVEGLLIQLTAEGNDPSSYHFASPV